LSEAEGTPVTSRVAILLSTYNGAQFLAEQLASLKAQSFQDWVLYWRDDGSTDASARIVADFLATGGARKSVAVPGNGRVGASASFLRLLRAATRDGCGTVAFCDQDDVWLPEKLARGLATLGEVPEATPALYCARQVLVDAKLRRLGLSAMLRRPPGFPAALTQNIATGCTLMLNGAAARLIAASRAPGAILHDWWCYVLVAAAGGRLLFDEMPVVLYRQHGTNAVGVPSSLPRRGVAALRRGPTTFMNVFRQTVAALADQPELISATAREEVAAIARALGGGAMQRLRILRRGGLTRQTWLETMLFRWWFLRSRA
jgi:glycosyltransferase involved in cell wall biosynthesis